MADNQEDNKPSPDVERLRELLAKVAEFTAPGPWNSHDRSSMIWAPSLKGGETRLLDVRGWGYLTGGGHGALGWDEDRAIEAQKAIGKLVAQAVNALPALLAIAEEGGRLRERLARTENAVLDVQAKRHRAIDRAEKAEAEAAALRGALEEIAEGVDVGRHDGLPEDGPAHDAETMFALARSALNPTRGK